MKTELPQISDFRAESAEASNAKSFAFGADNLPPRHRSMNRLRHWPHFTINKARYSTGVRPSSDSCSTISYRKAT